MSLESIATFSLSRLQVLDESGQVDKELEPKLSDSELLALYRFMLLCRRADERLIKLQRQGRVGTCSGSIGQEATICGATFAMLEKDWLVPSYREINADLIRGGNLSRTYMYFSGMEEGNYKNSNKRSLPVAVIVGSQTLHAVGIAYALKYRGENDSVVVVFFGEGASSQGDVHEALNFAAIWKVPVIFICQNNQWAISLPRNKQTSSCTIAQKAFAYGIPGIQVDGNDALAIYRATKEAMDNARKGLGPSLIEAENYRLTMHTSADDPSKYRMDEEVDLWWKKEPLIRFQIYLKAKKILSSDVEERLEDEVKQEVETAVEEFESIKDLKADAPFDNIYGTTHSLIESQRAEFLAKL